MRESLNTEELNSILATGGVLSDEITSFAMDRIGAEYGYAGEVYRITAETTDGKTTMVAKLESSEDVTRAAHASRELREVLGSHIPTLLGVGDQVTVWEDIVGRQGDGEADVARHELEDLLAVLASVHAATWCGDRAEVPHKAPSVTLVAWQDDRWEDRIDRARRRYSNQLDENLVARLEHLHDEIPDAIAFLEREPVALAHFDAHFDNVKWRQSGTMVLLDWSNARYAPPAKDVGPQILHDAMTPDEVITTYLSQMHLNGVNYPVSLFRESMRQTLRLDVRGMIGFAGFPEEPKHPRLLQHRDGSIERARMALRWIDS